MESASAKWKIGRVVKETRKFDPGPVQATIFWRYGFQSPDGMSEDCL